MFLLVLIITITCLCLIFRLLGWVLSKNYEVIRLWKNSRFECGIDTKSERHIPFSLRFFILAVIFLVFDVELVLLLPLAVFSTFFNLKLIFLGVVFIVLLLLGTIYEINTGGLSWIKYFG